MPYQNHVLHIKKSYGRVSVAEGRKTFLVPDIITQPYYKDLPCQEKLASLLAKDRANAVRVYTNAEMADAIPAGYDYHHKTARSITSIIACTNTRWKQKHICLCLQLSCVIGMTVRITAVT